MRNTSANTRFVLLLILLVAMACETPKPTTSVCAAPPTCDSGDTQVSGPSACLQDDAACYQRTGCDTTIWCTGTRPICDDGLTAVPTASDCVPGRPCVQVNHWTGTLWCTAGVNRTDNTPQCDTGDTQISGPGECWHDNAVCYERSLGSVTIWCTGTRSPCPDNLVRVQTQAECPQDAPCVESHDWTGQIWCTITL